MLKVDRREVDAATVIAVEGEVDLYSSPQMREALLAAIKAGSARVVVDLTGVSYMDSSGIATLVEALGGLREKGRALVLAGLRPRVREVFEIAKLQTVFTLAESVDAALADG
ncbi:MAG: STAS domain-containing protein [Acidobacteriota bacterium]